MLDPCNTALLADNLQCSTATTLGIIEAGKVSISVTYLTIFHSIVGLSYVHDEI